MEPTPSIARSPRFKGYFWNGSYGKAPAITSGKVFFNTRDGYKGFCSGTAVASRNESLVWTAGHCLYNPEYGGWVRNFVFCPGYDHGCQFGKWGWKTEAVTPEWHRYLSLRYDLGAVEVYPNHGHTLTDSVGGQGIAWNLKADQYWYALGYPMENPFDGESLYICEDRTERLGKPPPIPGPGTIGINCDSTKGASGGGWLIDLSRRGWGYVDTVDSYQGRHPLWKYGPYQGNAARDLYRLEGH
jgi:hypothetical protein